jgi:GNAT superfamily N-acetyltransferase
MAAVVSVAPAILVIRIERCPIEMQAEAARMLARAFVTNPLHIAAFGASQLAANERFFRIGLSAMKGPQFAALDGERIVGLIHWVHSPNCQISAIERLRLTPGMMRQFGIRRALSIGRWLSTWSKHDPAEPHVHLGPIGVAPEAQRRQIGHRLMERYCEHLHDTGAIGYLETDRPTNVDFYRQFGFEVTTRVEVLGVTNYLMRRERKILKSSSP